MVFKVLCLTLLACALTQAAPQYTITIPNPMDVLKKVGDAAVETSQDVKESFRTKIDAWFDVGKAVYDAGVQSADTTLTVVKAPFDFGSKLWDKVSNDGPTALDKFEGLQLD